MAKRKTVKKSKPKSVVAKRKIEKLLQADGMSEEKELQPTTLSQVWGDTGRSKYKTLDEKEYIESLTSLSKSDLQAEAHRIGLIPIDNANQLKGRLIKAFKAHVVSYKDRPAAHSLSTRGSGLEEKVKDILSDAR